MNLEKKLIDLIRQFSKVQDTKSEKKKGRKIRRSDGGGQGVVRAEG